MSKEWNEKKTKQTFTSQYIFLLSTKKYNKTLILKQTMSILKPQKINKNVLLFENNDIKQTKIIANFSLLKWKELYFLFVNLLRREKKKKWWIAKLVILLGMRNCWVRSILSKYFIEMEMVKIRLLWWGQLKID